MTKTLAGLMDDTGMGSAFTVITQVSGLVSRILHSAISLKTNMDMSVHFLEMLVLELKARGHKIL